MTKNQTRRKPVEILLVEDNPGDIRLTQEAFKSGQVPTNLSVTRDGVEALAFLRRKGQYTTAIRPDLIFLDLNLPKKNGYEVLAEVKSDRDLKRIPVIILSTSTAERDITRVYDMYANSYISKPVDLDQFIEIVKMVEAFWLTIAKLPLN